MASGAVRFNHIDVPRQMGERARLRVADGPDRGAVYVLFAPKVIIGRGENCDVIVADLRASRQHATMTLSPTGWTVQDLGSINGIQVNGQTSKTAPLKIGQSFSLGETTFEFVPSEAATTIMRLPLGSDAFRKAKITSPKAGAGPLSGLVNGMQTGHGSAGLAGVSSGSADTRKKVLMGAVLLLLVWVLMDDSSQDDGAKKKKKANTADQVAKTDTAETGRNLASFLPQSKVPHAQREAAENFFKQGFREYRERNYLRAMRHFENALQIFPEYGIARQYLDSAKAARDVTVQTEMDLAKQTFGSGKLKSSKAHFEAVMRLLSKEVERPEFIESKEQIEVINKKMKGDEG